MGPSWVPWDAAREARRWLVIMEAAVLLKFGLPKSVYQFIHMFHRASLARVGRVV